MKTSRWKRYDEKSGLWIASSKPVFGYWFRFLKHAENDPDYEVDWSLYEEWGGRDYILNNTEYAWWKAKWKTLFGYEEGEEDKILYPLSTPKPQPDGIRLSLMVYEQKHKPLFDGIKDDANGLVGDKWEIAKYVARNEYKRRTKRREKDPSFDPDKWDFTIARSKEVAKRMMKEDPAEFRKQKRTLQSRVGRYMRQADKHLDNVCKGQFP
jgi:hypothetical protein